MFRSVVIPHKTLQKKLSLVLDGHRKKYRSHGISTLSIDARLPYFSFRFIYIRTHLSCGLYVYKLLYIDNPFFYFSISNKKDIKHF